MLIRLLLLLLVALPLSGGKASSADQARGSSNLKGQFLVAAPSMGDPRFAKAVILILEHDDTGAMGLIVNQKMGSGPLNGFLRGFGIEPPNDGDRIKGETMRLHYGGPLEGEALFVIHSRDVTIPASNLVLDDVAVTTNVEVLKRLARGQGPQRYLMVLGYSGWGPGQLESEIERDDWVSAPADAGIIFAEDPQAVWDKVLNAAGLNL